VAEDNGKKIEEQKRLIDLAREYLGIVGEIDEAEEKRFAKVGKWVDAQKKRSENLEAEVGALDKQIERYKDLGSSQEARAIQAQAILDRENKMLALIKQEIADGKRSGDQAIKDLKTQEKRTEQAEKQLNKVKGATEALKEGVKAGKELGKSLGAAFAQYGKHQFFNADKLVGLGKALWSLKDGMAGVNAFMGSLVTGALSAITNSFINLIFQLDESQSAFLRATGAGDEYAVQLSGIYEKTREYGAELKEVQGTMQELYTTYTDFTMISGEQRDDLIETGVLLNELGVSNKDYAKSLQISTKSLGLSSTAAAANARELASLAKEIGVAPAKMGADFAAAGAGIAKLGSEGVRAFKDLAIVSKTTGLEINKLLMITDKFDTFEGAATQAGKLNAALGGNFVNAMDLMTATDPVERFNMIRDSILNTGLTFDDMSYYQRIFYKDALGLSDVSDLALMLSGDMSTLAGANQKTTKDYKKLRDETERVQNITEQFRAIMMSLIPVVQPLVKDIQDWVQKLKDGSPELERLKAGVAKFTEVLIAVGHGIAFAAKHWKWLVAAWAAFNIRGWLVSLARPVLTFFSTQFPASAAASGAAIEETGKKVADAVDEVGSSAQRNSAGLFTLATAIVSIGASVALAAIGLAILVNSFAEVGDNAGWAVLSIFLVLAAITAMVFGLLLLAPSGAAAAAGLAPLAGIILAIGVAVAIAAIGVGYMSKMMTGMFDSLDPVKVLAFTAFLLSVSLFGAMAVFATAGLLLFTAAMAAFGFSLRFFPSKKLNPITGFFASLAMVGAVATDLHKVALAIAEINSRIRELPDKKAIDFTTTMDSLTNAQAAAKNIVATAPARAGAAGTGTERPYEVKMELTLDGTKIGDKFFTLMAGKLMEEALS
jgi:hypothetical protein